MNERLNERIDKEQWMNWPNLKMSEWTRIRNIHEYNWWMDEWMNKIMKDEWINESRKKGCIGCPWINKIRKDEYDDHRWVRLGKMNRMTLDE